MLFAMVSLVER